MELLQIRYFLDVAETEHVTRSSERLRVAQPAITQAIRRLEDELGVPLFAKSGRNIVITEYGKYLRDRLLPLAREFDALPEDMRTMANLENSTIHMNVTAASSLVMDAIAGYVRDFEGVDFRVTQRAEGGLFDIRVSTRLPESPSPGEKVFSEKIFIAAPNRGAYSGMNEICLKDLAGERFVSLQGTRGLRLICDQFCRQAGFAPHVAFESDDPGAVRNMIAANMGVGFWPEFTWGAIDTDRVRLIGVKEPICQRDIVLTLRENKVDNSEVRRFFGYLINCFNKRRL